MIYFDRISKLPVKVEFQQINERGIRVRVADEHSQWHRNQGVLSPTRIDRFVNGRRSAQYFFLKISYNGNIRDDLFSKPAPKPKRRR